MTATIVVKLATTTSLTTTNANTVYGESATLTAIVAAQPPASGTPTGTVTFFDGASQLCTNVALNVSATATCSTAPLTVGTHTITATYNGDSSFNTSSSSAIQQMVSQGSSTTALTSSPNPSGGNLVVTFTATVTINAPGSGVPTGIVRFKEGATQLCPDVTLSNGVGQCLTSALSPGVHGVNADYLGDVNVIGSTSNTVQQTVHVPPPVPQAFHAEATDANTVSMGWQTATGADSYEVFRRSNINGQVLLPPTRCCLLTRRSCIRSMRSQRTACLC